MADALFRKILVPVDFSSCSEEAFRVALQLGHVFGSAIILIHVIDLSAFNRLGLLAVPSDAVAQRKRLRHHARLKMRQLLQPLPADGLQVDRVIVEGTPFVEIGKFVRQTRVDLIVLGSYGGRSESMEKIFFGATAEKVIRTAGCAVLTVPLPAKKTVS